MKHLRLILSLAVLHALLCVPAFAQFRVEGAFKGGVNFSDLGGSDAGNTNTNTGVIGGFSVTFRIAGILNIQPEMLYSRKGADQFSILQERYILSDADIVLDYVEFPLLVKLTFPMAQNMVPNVYVGPALAVKLRSKLHIPEARSENGTPLGVMDLKIVNAKTTDVSLVIGTGVVLEGPTTKVIVDFRYTFGLHDFLKEHAFVANDTEISLLRDDGQPLNLKNRTIAVMVGMAF